jgi:hypothetical protein
MASHLPPLTGPDTTTVSLSPPIPQTRLRLCPQVPILADILFSPAAGPHSAALAAIYAPYLLLPLVLVVRMAVSPLPFGSKRSQKRAKGGPKTA